MSFVGSFIFVVLRVSKDWELLFCVGSRDERRDAFSTADSALTLSGPGRSAPPSWTLVRT